MDHQLCSGCTNLMNIEVTAQIMCNVDAGFALCGRFVLGLPVLLPGCLLVAMVGIVY